MPQDTQSEIDAFTRWLATNPAQAAAYFADPRAYVETASLSPEARVRLLMLGVPAVKRAIEGHAMDIRTSINEANYGRDASAQGFGARKPSDS